MSGSGLNMYIPCLYEPEAASNKYALVSGDILSNAGGLEGFINPNITDNVSLFNNVPSTHSQVFKTPYNTNHANIG